MGELINRYFNFNIIISIEYCFPVVPSGIPTVLPRGKCLLSQMFMELLEEFPVISICRPKKNCQYKECNNMLFR